MSQAEEKLIAKLKDAYERAAKAQGPVLEEMEQARLFYRGDQWIYYRNGWRTKPVPQWRVRLTVNKLIPMVDLLIATATRNRPIVTAEPRSDDQDDRDSAKIAEMLARYYWQELNMDAIEREKLKYVFVQGNVFTLVDWDSDKKLPVFSVMPPSSMSIEPGAAKFEDAGWAMATEISRIDELELRYNRKIERAALDKDSQRSYVPVIQENEEADLKERTVLQRYYERPSLKFKRGRYIVRAGDNIVVDDPLPIKEIPEIPIVHSYGISLLGELWATSPVSQVIPLQKELNRSRSQLIENRNLCSRPQLLAAQGAMDEDDYTNEPGNIVWWDPVLGKQNEPHYMQPPSVPQWVQNIMSVSEKDMYDLVGRHEVSQGSSGGINNASQTGMLQRADDSRWAPMIRQNEESLRKMMKFALALAQQHLSGRQVINIVGRGRQSEIFKFKAESITSGVNVRFDIASQLPWSKESMRQMAIQMHRAGDLDDETYHQIMELPSQDKLFEPKQDHVLNARLENELLETMYFEPLPSDDNAVHIAEHMRPVNDPSRRAALIEQMALDRERAALTGQAPRPIPSSIENILRHAEAHRKRLPQPTPPPPAPKVNLGLDRLIRDLLQTNPQAAQALMPYVEELLKDSLHAQEPPPQSAAAGVAPSVPRGTGPAGALPAGTRAPVTGPQAVTMPMPGEQGIG